MKKLLRHKKAILIAIITGTLFSAIFYAFAWYEMARQSQDRAIKATELFAIYDNELNSLVYSNIYLVRGLIAYSQTNENLEDENIYRYMDHLLKNQMHIINNVGILKDTTIIWNYPYEDNKSTIGVDLSKNDAQKAYVNIVKSTLRPLFQGPVDLIQGGTGYILRYPILDINNRYWGQASIILKADVFINSLKSFEDQLGVKSIITSSDRVIHGIDIQEAEDVYWFDLNDDLFTWRIGIKLNESFGNDYLKMIALFIVSFIVLLIFSASAFLVVRANEVIKHESIHDHLTGLKNRNTLDETMQQVFAAADRNDHMVGILLIDLNKFKEINDTHGHAAGDEVLKETAQRLKLAARSSEMIFRVGGDEFLVVVPVIESEDNLQKVIDRLRSHLTFKLEVAGYQITITASIGRSIYSNDGCDFDTLFKIADKHMYEEKNKSIM
jgi:diguanylate cyclase (GGDEF)-like protein